MRFNGDHCKDFWVWDHSIYWTSDWRSMRKNCSHLAMIQSLSMKSTHRAVEPKDGKSTWAFDHLVWGPLKVVPETRLFWTFQLGDPINSIFVQARLCLYISFCLFVARSKWNSPKQNDIPYLRLGWGTEVGIISVAKHIAWLKCGGAWGRGTSCSDLAVKSLNKAKVKHSLFSFLFSMWLNILWFLYTVSEIHNWAFI